MADQARLTIVLTDQTVSQPRSQTPAASAPITPTTGAARPASTRPSSLTAAEAAQFDKTYGKDARSLVEAQIGATAAPQSPVSEPTGTARPIDQTVQATGAAKSAPVHRTGTGAGREVPQPTGDHPILNVLQRAATLLGGGFLGSISRSIAAVLDFGRAVEHAGRSQRSSAATQQIAPRAAAATEQPRILSAATQATAVAAPSVAGTAGAAGAAAATGTATTSSIAAISMALGPVGIAAGLVVIGFGLLAKATQMLYQWMSRSAEQLEKWHAGLATANARASIIAMQAERRRAAALGDDLARFQLAKARTGSVLSDNFTVAMQPLVHAATRMMEIFADVAEMLKPLSKIVILLNPISIAMRGISFVLDKIGDIIRWMKDHWPFGSEENDDAQFNSEIKKLDTLYESLLNMPHQQGRMPVNVQPGDQFGGFQL